jgi:hypothetical protein
MNLPKPIDNIEEKIMNDKEFLTAIEIGRPRSNHDEGTIKAHIIHIIGYIEKKYHDTAPYKDLRKIALLHDVGKFAFLKERRDIYMPEIPEKKQEQLIEKCKEFKKKYYLSEPLPKNIQIYKYTSNHSYASYQFAKKFIKDPRILEIIRYHDLGVDIKLECMKNQKYDTEFFKKVFSNIDIELYLAFLKCDNSNRKDKTSKWLKTELRKHDIK